MTDIECKHINWISKEYGHIKDHSKCDIYEVYCMDCKEYFHTITKEVIPHPTKYPPIK